MSASGASFPITFTLVAQDNASSTFETLNSVMKEGRAAGSDTIAQFQSIRSETRLQTGALSTLVNQFRIGNENAALFARGLSAAGAVGQTMLSIVTAMSTSQLALAQAQDAVTATTQKVADDQNYYNQMVAQYGSSSKPALDALDQLHTDQANLIQQSAELNRANLQTDLMYVGIGLSVGGMAAQVITAMPYLEALSVDIARNAEVLDVGTASYIASTIAEGAWAVVTGIASGAMALLNAVMDANPIVLVGLAIIGLVAVLYELTDGFKNFGVAGQLAKSVWADLTTAGNDLDSGLKAAWGDISTGWDALMNDLYSNGTLHLGLLNINVGQFSQAVQSAFSDIKSFAGGIWSDFTGILQSVWNTFSGIFTPIWNTFWNTFGTPIQAAITVVEQALKAFVNFFIDAINNIINTYDAIAMAINSVSSKVGITLTIIPDIPHLAQGGIVTSPTVALIGENGAEAVQPLPAGGIYGSQGSGGGGDVYINVEGSVLSENDLLNTVNRGLYTHGYARRARR